MEEKKENKHISGIYIRWKIFENAKRIKDAKIIQLKISIRYLSDDNKLLQFLQVSKILQAKNIKIRLEKLFSLDICGFLVCG